MPVLDKAFFSGTGNPDTRVSATAEILDKGEGLSEALGLLGCEDAALIGCVILFTTADNTQVDHAEFALRGCIEVNEIRIPCNKIWSTADKGLFLYLSIPDAELFHFTSGGLASEYIAQEDTKHYYGDYTEGRAPHRFTADAAKEKNAGDFCIRAIVQLAKSEPSKGVRISVTILLFADSKTATIAAADASMGAGWPGLFILETDCLLGPNSTSEWGCPIVPLLMTGTPLKRNPRVPSGDQMRRAIGALMGRSYRPEFYKVAATASQKANHYAAHPEDFADKPSGTTWPKQPAATAAEKGEFYFPHILYSSYVGVLSEPA